MLGENHVSLLALIFILVIMSIPEWLALFVWWKMRKTIDAKFRELANDRAARASEALRRAYGSEAAEEVGEDYFWPSVEGMPPRRPSVEGSRDGVSGTEVPPMRPGTPQTRED